MSRRLKGALSAMAMQQESVLAAAVLERLREILKRQRERIDSRIQIRAVTEAECRLGGGGG
jgi:hypothetical protein